MCCKFSKIRQKVASISLFGTPHAEQPPVFARILWALMEYRSRTGRPHWYIIDEAHYPLSAKWQPTVDLHLEELRSVMFITSFIDQLPKTVLHDIDLFVAIGDEPAKHLAQYCKLLGEPTPELAAAARSTRAPRDCLVAARRQARLVQAASSDRCNH